MLQSQSTSCSRNGKWLRSENFISAQCHVVALGSVESGVSNAERVVADHGAALLLGDHSGHGDTSLAAGVRRDGRGIAVSIGIT